MWKFIQSTGCGYQQGRRGTATNNVAAHDRDSVRTRNLLPVLTMDQDAPPPYHLENFVCASPPPDYMPVPTLDCTSNKAEMGENDAVAAERESTLDAVPYLPSLCTPEEHSEFKDWVSRTQGTHRQYIIMSYSMLKSIAMHCREHPWCHNHTRSNCYNGLLVRGPRRPHAKARAWRFGEAPPAAQ